MLGVNRGSVYHLPRAASGADLTLMRRIDELHLAHPFMSACMLRDQPALAGLDVGGRLVRTLMLPKMKSPVRPELPTVAARSSQATLVAVNNPASFLNCLEST